MSVRRFLAALLGLLAVLALIGAPESGRAAPRKHRHAASHFRGCRLQRPQRFLERRSFVKNGRLQGKQHERALRYRVETYGNVNVPGMELAKYNSSTAFSHAKSTTFFGLPLQVHEAIVPALQCVEHRIKQVCRGRHERYTPKAVGGFRQENTYHHGEVSNHLFGIAVDIDPDRNPCCGCVKPWPDNPICKKDAKSIYDQTSLPRCWVQAFERYGFYWLGRDELKDTMHFEFLGKPERIVP